MLGEAHTHTPLLYPLSDAILITSLRFDLSPPDQMADVFILEGAGMNQEWFHDAQGHKTGRWARVSEDDGAVCVPAGESRRSIAQPLCIYILCEEKRVPWSQTDIVPVY